MGDRKAFLLRLDPATYDALQRWAAGDLRSLNAQIEYLLRDALRKAGRAPRPDPSTPAGSGSTTDPDPLTDT